MKFFKLPIYALAAALMTAPTVANAWWWHWDDDDEVEIPFEEAEIFFELNDTDGDLGIHADVDGDPWKKLEMEDPNERSLLKVYLRGKLRRQGLTEFSFESAEPLFESDDPDEETLDPEVFFGRFPEGEYEIEGTTLDGGELESEVVLSHIIPAAPEILFIGGEPFNEDDCTVDVPNSGDVIVEWEAVTESHFDKWDGTDKLALGKSGDVEVMYYEFVAEVDDEDWKSTTIIPPMAGINSMTIPAKFFELIGNVEEVKIEILVRVENDEGDPGNKSAVETCFVFVE